MQPFYTYPELGGLPTDARLGVIGNPIAHSKSPQMQQAALDAAGAGLRYVRLLAGLEEGAFESLLTALAERAFVGVNVTVPFKKKACAAACRRDALSRLCGAANTLRLTPEGWEAFNTDGPGFSRAIEELGGRPLSSLRIVLLGACGGAGSALACQCALSGCASLALVNRPRPQLQELADTLATCFPAEKLSCCHFASPSLRETVQQADLVVNATSLGLHPGDALPLPPEYLRAGQMVYDIVTHDTPLVAAAAERGCIASTGIRMLLWQGAFAFRHWLGYMPDIAAMEHGLAHA